MLLAITACKLMLLQTTNRKRISVQLKRKVVMNLRITNDDEYGENASHRNVGLSACNAWVYGPCMPVSEAAMRSYMCIYRQNDARDRKCITLHACKA